MRVSLIGQAAFGEAALRRLQAEGVELSGVSAPAPRDPGRPDPLWKAAEEAGIPLLDTASLKSPGGLGQWAAIAGDLCVMAFVTEILPDSVFGLPRQGTVQYHPSLLPLHRGSSAINWAIINGDTETGLTMFWPEKGIDAGPVLLQKRCPIGPDDTVGSLYFDKLFPMGIDAVAESVALVAAGNPPHHAQDHALATYEPPCGEPHGEIRWHEPAHQIYARIRGCNPQPGAWTTYADAKLRFFDSRLTGEQAAGMPGRVLTVDGDGFTVRLNGGVLRVLRVQPEGAKKTGAGEWAAAAGLREGFRFR